MIDIKNLEEQFRDTYINFKWRHGNNESKSGLGSTLDFTSGYRNNLIELIKKYKLNKILDCSCGDWNWMKTISNDLNEYVGLDIVKEIVDTNNHNFSSEKIKFINNDMLTYLENCNEKYDLIISRHTFEHLPTEYVLNVMSQIKNKTKYFLFSGQNNLIQNTDINFDGCSSRNINLELDPYISLLGKPIYSFYDSPINNENNSVYTHVFGHFYSSL
jgi:2-polyprenyl-3-methyl-5-hydroxy-6-metoxy-1,4-benzoquinol methylase